MRYTEYHSGVAVIKDKNLLKEAMQKLAEFEDAEEQGRLVELLCAVGERIYMLDADGKPREMTLDPPDIRCHCAKEDNLCMATCNAPKTGMCAYGLMNDGSDIEKRVFLTLEAAQEALWEMEKAEGRR